MLIPPSGAHASLGEGLAKSTCRGAALRGGKSYMHFRNPSDYMRASRIGAIAKSHISMQDFMTSAEKLM
jgi:hypothetical protein